VSIFGKLIDTTSHRVDAISLPEANGVPVHSVHLLPGLSWSGYQVLLIKDAALGDDPLSAPK
jgi:hypothetical protein